MDRPASEMAEAYALLAYVNRICQLARPFQRFLPKMLGEERCRSLTLLDLGAGDGWLGNELQRWAAARGWDWRVTNLDLNARALSLNHNSPCVVGSALALPFRDGAFDVVIASQMAHHLATDDEVCLHFKEGWRVAREGCSTICTATWDYTGRSGCCEARAGRFSPTGWCRSARLARERMARWPDARKYPTRVWRTTVRG